MKSKKGRFVSRSTNFVAFVQALGSAKSKQEEDTLISQELAKSKLQLSDNTVDDKMRTELILLLAYCEMCGHAADFGYFSAVSMASSVSPVVKRIGYACASLFLSPEHEFSYLLVSTLQRDLNSTCILEIEAALSTAVKMASVDLIASLIDYTTSLLKHDSPRIRKKTVLLLCTFHRLVPNSTSEIQVYLSTLCDRDPQVMSAALCLCEEISTTDLEVSRHLTPSLVSILKQIIAHRLPSEYDYHRLPAPWMQIRILRIFSVLGKNDEKLSQECYEVVSEVMRRADIGIDIGNAVIYECILCAISLYPQTSILGEANLHICKFLASRIGNLRYVGLEALARIAKIDLLYAVQNQELILECLEDSDVMLRKKSFTLLCSMANPKNVDFIVRRLVRYLRYLKDVHQRSDLVRQILCMLDDYCTSQPEWYITQVGELCQLASESLPESFVSSLLCKFTERLIPLSESLSSSVIQISNRLLSAEQTFSDQVYAMCTWFIGEFGHYSPSFSPQTMLDSLSEIVDNSVIGYDAKQCALTAALKLFFRVPHLEMDSIHHVILENMSYFCIELQQQCYELIQLLKEESSSFTLTTSESDEANLPFLDGFVQNAAKHGSAPYDPDGLFTLKSHHQEHSGHDNEAFKLLLKHRNPSSEESLPLPDSEEDILHLPSKHRKWGKHEGESSHQLRSPSVDDVAIDEEIASMKTISMAEYSKNSFYVTQQKGADREKVRSSRREKLAKELFAGTSETSLVESNDTKISTVKRNTTEKKLYRSTDSSTSKNKNSNSSSRNTLDDLFGT